MVKIGQLYLDEGRWQGRQLVSAEWVREATIDQLTKEQRSDGFQQPWADGPYGYFWWVGDTESHNYFGAVGLYGQNIHVVPDSRLILVTVSDERGFPAPTEEFYATWTTSSLSRSSGPKWRGYPLVTIRRRVHQWQSLDSNSVIAGGRQRSRMKSAGWGRAANRAA
jgi:CubicO group peptidase (beta-lactamase class C family)